MLLVEVELLVISECFHKTSYAIKDHNMHCVNVYLDLFVCSTILKQLLNLITITNKKMLNKNKTNFKKSSYLIFLQRIDHILLLVDTNIIDKN